MKLKKVAMYDDSNNTEEMDEYQFVESKDSLYYDIADGSQKGLFIVDLGWSIFEIRETLGIESIIGLARFGTLSQFHGLMKEKTRSDLSDWEPVTLTLYQCWFPPVENSESEPSFCYCAWRLEPSSDALSSQTVPVFALRHRAWTLLQQGKEREFFCALERSLAEAKTKRRDPNAEITPEIMKMRNARGFCLTGKLPRSKSSTYLTWPSGDLEAVFRVADLKVKQGITNIELCESGIEIALKHINKSQRRQLVEIDLQMGGNSYLVDLLAAIGIK